MLSHQEQADSSTIAQRRVPGCIRDDLIHRAPKLRRPGTTRRSEQTPNLLRAKCRRLREHIEKVDGLR
jgi:hypothetical protein